MADAQTADLPAPDRAEDGEPVDPRYVLLQRLGWRIFATVVGLITFVTVAGLVAAAGALRVWIGVPLVVLWLVVMGALAWHAERWPARAYRHMRYRAEPDGIEIRRGVYWRTVTRVPRSRVQHTDVSQGPLERRYGLGTLVLYTAGTDHARVVLPGLAYENAMALRDRLKPVGGGDAV